jgi:hypothetical protein
MNFFPEIQTFAQAKRARRSKMAAGDKRSGAGRPKKPLSARLAEGIGEVRHETPKVIEFPPEQPPPKAEKAKTAKIMTFLEMTSKEGGDILPTASEIHAETVEWIKKTGCEQFIMPQLIQDFALTRRSYLESEYMNKRLGRVVQGARGGMLSPYVKASIEYLKQMTQLYREIWMIIAQNSTTEYTRNGSNVFLDELENRGF